MATQNYINVCCPDCDWESGEWMAYKELQVRQDFITHWLDNHAPSPPLPDVIRYADSEADEEELDTSDTL